MCDSLVSSNAEETAGDETKSGYSGVKLDDGCCFLDAEVPVFLNLLWANKEEKSVTVSTIGLVW